MKSNHILRVKELFLAVIDLPEEQRDAYLAAHCRGDDALRDSVENLLDQDAAEPGTPNASLPAAHPLVHEDPAPERIGPYRILEIIGEGTGGWINPRKSSISLVTISRPENLRSSPGTGA